MSTPNRSDLEAAARRYFTDEAVKMDSPRGFDLDQFDCAVGYEIEMAREGIQQLDVQLINNEFEGSVYLAVSHMVGAMGLSFDGLPEGNRLLALQLAARSSRELARLYIHRLTQPVLEFRPEDMLFDHRIGEASVSHTVREDLLQSASAATVANASVDYMAWTKARKVGHSHMTETLRALGWLAEAVGGETPLGLVTNQQMKSFRDALQKVDKRLRGQKVPFAQRQTDQPHHQIGYATSSRYWRAIRAFFAWATEDQLIAVSPAEVAKIPRPKGLKVRSPEPFTTAELKRLLSTPLYSGYQSAKRVSKAGSCLIRSGHWWSGVLFMHTGLRAGELSQLEPNDFVFDCPVPHLRVREEGEGAVVKSVKNQASVRDVPLHPNLLTLGLEAFVEARQKKRPADRIFHEFRLGTNGRKSEGATRFWGDFLRANDLWRAGRATHVWRHTVVAGLRANGVAVEDVAALVGHTGSAGDLALFGQTIKYGGAYSLERKRDALLKLDYGLPLVQLLGGAYNAKLHGK